jgi:hypothetical protein
MAIGARSIQGATRRCGTTLDMTGDGPMEAMHEDGNANNTLDTGTRDQGLTLIGQDLCSKLGLLSVIQVIRLLPDAPSTPWL